LDRRDARDDGPAAARVGAGLSLLVLVVATCPKWPIEIALVALFGLHRVGAIAWREPRNLVWAVFPPLATLAIALALTLRSCSFGDYVFFVFRFNGEVVDAFRHSTFMIPLFEGEIFHYCPRPFRSGWPLLGLAIVVAAFVSPRASRAWGDLDREGLMLVFAIVVAALVEITFVYPFPYLWAQYYLMWSFGLAIVYGCVPAAVVALAPAGARGVAALPSEVAAVVGALAFHVYVVRDRLAPLPPDYYWGASASLLAKLEEGDTVWLEAEKHPLFAFDASYYWEGFPDGSHGALAYAIEHPGGRVPAEDETHFPICRLEQGLEPHLRFVAGGPDLLTMPTQGQCFRRLYLAGALKRTAMPGAFEVVRGNASRR
jgi:hypothetical protein